MEEVVGTIKVINQAIHTQKNLNDVEDKLTRKVLEDVPALQILQDKGHANAKVVLPISYVTAAIENSIRFQRGQDAITAEKSDTKLKASDGRSCWAGEAH
ncbi:hypothetical protein ABVK25_006797 [Lepraria finkii]|uniref:Uncharacterized protein n=1 Tax=Lepraria finkii TaxID=1340010 RepID=A0ABR4B4R1_9LECA